MNYDFDQEGKRGLIMKIIREIFLWALQIAAVILLAYFIVNYTVEKTNMVGVSMEETLYDGDPIIINKFSYRFRDPKRFEIIVFKQSGKEHSYYNIKRIVGLPGETIQIKDSKIYINGEAIEEPMNVEPMINYGLAEEEITLEENEYFVLGDKRNDSEDSRFASIGTIRREEIIGKAFLRLSPFNFVDKLNLKLEEIEEQE